MLSTEYSEPFTYALKLGFSWLHEISKFFMDQNWTSDWNIQFWTVPDHVLVHINIFWNRSWVNRKVLEVFFVLDQSKNIFPSFEDTNSLIKLPNTLAHNPINCPALPAYRPAMGLACQIWSFDFEGPDGETVSEASQVDVHERYHVTHWKRHFLELEQVAENWLNDYGQGWPDGTRIPGYEILPKYERPGKIEANVFTKRWRVSRSLTFWEVNSIRIFLWWIELGLVQPL